MASSGSSRKLNLDLNVLPAGECDLDDGASDNCLISNPNMKSPRRDGCVEEALEMMPQNSIESTGLGFVINPIFTDIKQFASAKFESVYKAHTAYCDFAHVRGFSVRRRYEKTKAKDKTIIRYMEYCCNKQGFRRNSNLNPLNQDPDNPKFKGESSRSSVRMLHETRVGCKAMISFRYDSTERVYRANRFCDEHNHQLQDETTRHILKSNRKVDEQHTNIAELGGKAGLTLKETYDLMRVMAGGSENVGFLKSDLKNVLNRNRRAMLQKGDAHAMIQYFKDKCTVETGFYYDLQIDEENQINSIFWADTYMRMDYAAFGDVVALDTTFNTNKNARPLAMFVGFNHHRKSCVFGAALLIDEAQTSFTWLITSFLKCMNGLAPKSIMTDQDPAMAAAIRNVLHKHIIVCARGTY